MEERNTIRRLFEEALARAGAPAGRAAEVARITETSCYNAVVKSCRDSDEPLQRRWDAQAFVDAYSTRCGTILLQLDPDSSVCRAYGATLAARLLAGEAAVADPGRLSEKELCPQATATERAELARRAEQKVAEKESVLFRCPFCGVSRCTYREVQRRALDEAPDYVCFCLGCKRAFKGR